MRYIIGITETQKKVEFSGYLCLNNRKEKFHFRRNMNVNNYYFPIFDNPEFASMYARWLNKHYKGNSKVRYRYYPLKLDVPNFQLSVNGNKKFEEVFDEESGLVISYYSMKYR